MNVKLTISIMIATLLVSHAFSEGNGKKKRKGKGKREASEETIQANNWGEAMLKSGTYVISQSWGDITNYKRPVHIQVPSGDGPFPVYIALHGKGGTGARKLKNLKKMAGRVIIAPDGYNKGWSVKRPDVDFIRTIITNIKSCTNVDGNNIAIHGSSNGAGLLNRLMIELEEGAFHHGICGIGGLGKDRHDGTNFLWDPKGGANFDTAIVPAKNRRWLQINGTDDQVIPYDGGPSRVGTDFMPAQDTFYLWAVHMGEKGPKLSDEAGKPHPSNNKLLIYEYLDGNFKHVKAVGYKHGVQGKEIKEIINEFISQPTMGR